MPLKAMVDDLEDVPEALHEFYTKQEDGTYRLDADGVEDVSGLKSALTKERRDRKKFEGELKKFGGVDLEKYEELLAQQEEQARKKAKGEGDWEAREKQLLDKHQAELQKRETRIKVLTEALEGHVIDAEATRAIVEAKGSPELLLPHVKRYARAVEQDGQFVPRVFDPAGTERIGDGAGSPMTLKQLVDEMRGKEAYARAFDGTGSSGTGGASTGSAGGGSIKRVDANDPLAIGRHLEAIAKGEVKVGE